jgi:hypothetical protein
LQVFVLVVLNLIDIDLSILSENNERSVFIFAVTTQSFMGLDSSLQQAFKRLGSLGSGTDISQVAQILFELIGRDLTAKPEEKASNLALLTHPIRGGDLKKKVRTVCPVMVCDVAGDLLVPEMLLYNKMVQMSGDGKITADRRLFFILHS